MKARVLPGDDPYHNQNVDFFKFLQIGTIVRVDNEMNRVDISFDSNPSIIPNISLSNPFFTGRSFIGGMPEVGTMVVCGFIKTMNDSGTPVILTYLNPLYIRSLNYSYDDGKTSPDLKSVDSVKDKIGYNVIRLKRRKLQPGDVNLESSHGSEIMLDEDIFISDANLNEILISSIDNSISSNSISNIMYAAGIRVTSGPANRPGALSSDKVVMSNGQSQTIITDNTNSVDMGGQPFSEYRIDVNEMSTGTLIPTQNFEKADFESSAPDGTYLVSQSFGTTIGNTKANTSLYGRVLRPQIFTSVNDSTLDIKDVTCIPNEYSTISGAYQLKFKSGTKIDIDKEGHSFVRIAASTGRHPLGAGRSLELATDGSIKAFIGKNVNQQQSIDLETSGACSIHFGNDDKALKSLDWVLERSMYISVKASDKSGFALKETYVGNVEQNVTGNKVLNVSGNYTVNVQGKIQENILGMRVENYVNDKTTNYGGNYNEVVVKSRTTNIGGGFTSSDGEHTVIANGDSSLNIKIKGNRIEKYTLGNKDVTLLKGDSLETLLLGDRKTNVTVGSIKETIVSGDKTTTITTGDFKVNVTAGVIEIVNAAGSIKISTTGATIDITSTAAINVKAPVVNLGPTAAGMVVTNVTHPFDYITGLPIIGTPTVNAG